MKGSRTLGFVVLIMSLGVGSPGAHAQMPKTITIGTMTPGSLNYALGSGLAKVVSEAGPSKAIVQPYGGTTTFLPLLNGGELDFGMMTSAELWLAYPGPAKLKVGGRNPFPHSPNIRLVMRGSPLIAGLLVRKDSPIKSVHDFRGRRVTGEYPASLTVWYLIYGALASAGMTWSDVNVVPVTAVNDGIDALVQGRADVSLSSLNQPKLREADATVGVRHVSIECSPEGQERLRRALPPYYPVVIKARQAVAVVEDTCMLANDSIFVTHKSAPDHLVAAVLKAIWDDVDKLPSLHPTFKQWTRDRAVHPEAPGPYHPGAVSFYKERGIWTAAMDQAQQRLLAVNP